MCSRNSSRISGRRFSCPGGGLRDGLAVFHSQWIGQHVFRHLGFVVDGFRHLGRRGTAKPRRARSRSSRTILFTGASPGLREQISAMGQDVGLTQADERVDILRWSAAHDLCHPTEIWPHEALWQACRADLQRAEWPDSRRFDWSEPAVPTAS